MTGQFTRTEFATQYMQLLNSIEENTDQAVTTSQEFGDRFDMPSDWLKRIEIGLDIMS